MFTQIHSETDKQQTHASFDYQWRYLNYGNALPDDNNFMNELSDHICELTQLDSKWFNNKHILDMGCGSGRYTYGFLQLGGMVDAVDYTEWGIKRTAELCKDYAGRLNLSRQDILTWDKPNNYDMVWCFGVLHHTGDFKTALDNTINKVASGGYLFIMAYNKYSYQGLNDELKNLSFDDKVVALSKTHDNRQLHGFFDASSPSINDATNIDYIIKYLSKHKFCVVKKHNRREVIMKREKDIIRTDGYDKNIF